MATTNSSGALTSSRGYRAYGNYRRGGDLPTDYRFTGQQQDASGLVYMNARYYDPALGQFISPDTLVPDAGVLMDYNRYGYARGNPMRFTDPTGHDPIDAAWRAEFEQVHGRSPIAEDILIRLYSVAFPNEWNWSAFYNADGSYIDGSINKAFEETSRRSWEDIPNSFASLAGWYTTDEGRLLTRDIGTLFGGLLNRLEQPDAWATISFPSNPARVWVHVGEEGQAQSLIGNDPDANIHHWGWAVAIGGSQFDAIGEVLNTTREFSQLRIDQLLSPPLDFYADVAIGNAGVVLGRRISNNSGGNIQQDFHETMTYWSGYFQGGGSR